MTWELTGRRRIGTTSNTDLCENTKPQPPRLPQLKNGLLEVPECPPVPQYFNTVTDWLVTPNTATQLFLSVAVQQWLMPHEKQNALL